MSNPLLSTSSRSRSRTHLKLREASNDERLKENIYHIGEVLTKHLKDGSIRAFFRSLDSNYGYVTVKQLRKLLDDEQYGFNDLSSQEKDLVVQYCDSTDLSDGRIDYKEFFGTFFAHHLKEKLKEQGRGTLKQVLVITRHGVRFPLGVMPLNSSWPCHPQFWERYGGKLTPEGVNQHIKLGKQLSKFYMEELGLFTDDVEFAERLHVYTSNTDRTLLSASSLLYGFCPEVAHSYAVEDEPSRESRNYQGIRIHVANTARKHTPILHGYKGNIKHDYLKAKALEKSPIFKEYSEKQKYVDLLDRLWKLTEQSCVDPKKTVIHRLMHLSPLHTQVSIERALNMQTFANVKGYPFIKKDEKKLEKLADASKHIKFQGNSDEDQHEIARGAAGLLPFEILKNFRERMKLEIPKSGPPRRKKFVLLSAHDYTIMSLLSHLGYKNWKIPDFASYVLIELHLIKDKYYVRLFYNNNPRLKKHDSLKPYKIPKDNKIVEMEDSICEMEDSLMLYDDFYDLLMNIKKSFSSEEEWKADGDSNEEANDLASKKKIEHDEPLDMDPEGTEVGAEHLEHRDNGNSKAKKNKANESKEKKADESKEKKADESKEKKADESKEKKADESKEKKADESKEKAK